MFIPILFFLLGDLYLQTFAKLPGFISPVFLLLIKPIFVTFALGFLWTNWYAHNIASWTLAKELEQRPISITGYITSLPLKNHFGTKFLFSLDGTHALLSLNTSDPNLNLHPGDHWKFQARLKRIQGVQSPGAFDYEAWAYMKNIRATGKILSGELLESNWYHYPLQRLREHLKTRLHLSEYNPWLTALILGERENIPPEDWKVLRATGTNHLMAIAGLHIGMLALIIHLITTRLWRHEKLLLLLPSHLAGSLAGLICAVTYSAIAGFSLPTQRACIMILIYVLTLFKRIQTNPWNIWSATLLILLLLNPLSVLSESFWLSLLTIAFIHYGMSARYNPKGWWWHYGRVQWVIAIAMLPSSLYFFQQISLVSFIANCLAIPILSIILPFCFFSIIIPSLLIFADMILKVLWLLLSTLAHYQFAAFNHAVFNSFILLSIVIGTISLLLPKGVPGKILGLLWVLPLFSVPAKLHHGEMKMNILDVGQGLSVVVQTRNHNLVYDTGPGSDYQTDMGERVVVPFLLQSGINKIDMLVISHGDNDHIGGAKSLLVAIPVTEIKTSAVEKIMTPVTSFCQSGANWNWDGINFSFIYPYQQNTKRKNDNSCVLRIDNGHQSILLPGDIEKFGERQLIKNHEVLKSSILIAPHHGSKTSALPNFIAAVKPDYVFYATGYLNRYHFPHPSVVSEYAKIKAVQGNTAITGTVEIHLGKSEMSIKPYRVRYRHYWFNPNRVFYSKD